MAQPIQFNLICAERIRLGADSPVEKCQLRREHLGAHKFEATIEGTHIEIRWEKVGADAS